MNEEIKAYEKIAEYLMDMPLNTEIETEKRDYIIDTLIAQEIEHLIDSEELK
jgi:hypothetical protein